ncbi:MAG TPA: DMT family transporter [Flavihumibacter sp.]|nr:DMT family transporter [Flavihumibacter sp.]
MKSAFLKLHMAVFLAGFTGILGRLITLNEGLLVWYRLLISAGTFWILFSLQGKLQKIPRASILRIFGIGAIAALHWVCFYGSIKYANVSVALVCFSAVGFFTAILEPLILRRRFVPGELLLGMLVMLGIYLIFQFDPQYKTGIIIGMVSSLLGATFPILNRQVLKTVSVEILNTYELTGGFVVLSLLLPVYLHYFPTEHILPSWQDFGWLLFLSWICSVWAFQLVGFALKYISAFTVNLTYNLEPVYGILMAFAIFGENKNLNRNFYIGFSLILLAVLLQMYRVRRNSRS